MGHARHIASITTLAIAMGLPQPTIAQTNGNAVAPAAAQLAPREPLTGAALDAAVQAVVAATPRGVPLPAGTVCMTRHVTNNGGAPFDFEVMAPADKATVLATRGYTPIACTGSARKLAAYRVQVCAMAVQGNDAVENRLAEVFGERTELLCEHARTLEAKITTTVPATPATPVTAITSQQAAPG